MDHGLRTHLLERVREGGGIEEVAGDGVEAVRHRRLVAHGRHVVGGGEQGGQPAAEQPAGTGDEDAEPGHSGPRDPAPISPPSPRHR